MIDKLSEKIRNIGLGMIDDESGRNMLGDFYVSLSDYEKSNRSADFWLSLFNCLIEASDRLNDSIAPLFHMFIDNGCDVEAFKSAILLFDENIDLTKCKDLFFEAVIKHVSYDDFDEILKISSDQNEFERLLKEKIRGISESDPESVNKVGPDSIEHMPMEIEKDFINYLKTENERLTKQVDDLKGNLSDLQDKEKESAEILFALKSELSEKTLQLDNIKADFSKAKLSVALFENKYKKTQEMFEQERIINERLSVEVQPSFSSSDSSLEEKEAEINGLKETISKLDDENARLESQNESLRTENNRLSKEILSFKEENASLKDEVNGLRNNGLSSQSIPTISLDEGSSNDDMSFPFLHNIPGYNSDVLQDIPAFSSGFTADLFNDDEPEDYTDADIIAVENNKSSVLKSCNIFSKLLSKHFEKKFVKKPQAEQNNLIFMKLMEGNYSKEVLKTVRKAIEGNNSVSRIDLYKVISAKGDMNEILRLCNAA